jgi:pimeloyl-ACP methyl ester carboxylesterase
VTEHYFETNGVRLNYAEGPDNGKPLLLIPAQGTSWKTYDQVLEKMSLKFHVFAVTIRGHGKSSWTNGNYNFNTVGNDLVAFLENIVKHPAIISGNSSGGLIALWLAVNRPDLVTKIILEDAPLFSAEWPRIKNEFVYEVLSKTAEYLGKKKGPDYEGFFCSMKRPVPGGKTKTLPRWFARFMAWLIEHRHTLSAKILLSILPRRLHYMLTELPSYDPEFARAWVNGTFYEGLNHANALQKIKIPTLLIHANWYRTSEGLMGAMDDEDASRAKNISTQLTYIRVDATHGVHTAVPEKFIQMVSSFSNA